MFDFFLVVRHLPKQSYIKNFQISLLVLIQLWNYSLLKSIFEYYFNMNHWNFDDHPLVEYPPSNFITDKKKDVQCMSLLTYFKIVKFDKILFDQVELKEKKETLS